MNNLFTFLNAEITPLNPELVDDVTHELLQTEFGDKRSDESNETKRLIEKYGFCWDSLSIPGYLTFKPYAAFMEDATRLFVWKLVKQFCQKSQIPLHRISGGDLYSLHNDLMKRHVALAEQVGMYGDGLLKVSDDFILRFSGCSNKLAQLKSAMIEKATMPFGIFEISDSYRFETEDQISPLVRNRFFHLPELHIVNYDITQGLDTLLKGHYQMVQNMKEHNLDFIMLFSTTKRFVTEYPDFIEKICAGCNHPPIINITEAETCENGIVFDVEYKAKMSNGILVEIGTFQIDAGMTDFAYGINYNGKPITTVHAVFFASSIERTIFTYCDLSSMSGSLPDWLIPVHCRVIPLSKDFNGRATDFAVEWIDRIRIEVDDRVITVDEKINDAKLLKVPHIILVGNEIQMFDSMHGILQEYDASYLNTITENISCILEQYSPLLLSQRVIF